MQFWHTGQPAWLYLPAVQFVQEVAPMRLHIPTEQLAHHARTDTSPAASTSRWSFDHVPLGQLWREVSCLTRRPLGPSRCANQVSNLHYDRSHNFLTMVEGEKRVTLVPPSVRTCAPI